jgi:hypothetical protein
MFGFLKKIKFHQYFYILGTILAFGSLFLTSPGSGFIQVPFGAEVISKLSSLPAMVFAVFAIWIGTRTLFEYIDSSKLVEKASETSQGAALVFLGIQIGRVAIALLTMGMIATFS